ncbi:hypothetical protein MWU49_14445 [Alcanivorax sp. S6407]|uniref:hypothetical protein n=1 Tax=Alcanivorax sp. S6407 TaxID=2926424 RepID=UPI001FF68132|nr:hypothetical protein [Alcanivorax sp. S6407]MCK0154912.1 hypothetical protein [Alcanivorax sp. S6407]
MPSQCQTVLDQQQEEDDVYLALARADSQKQALTIALGDIANQLEMAIRSEASVVSSKQDGVSKQTFNHHITSISDFVFDDYQLVCQDHVRHEVLVRYDNRPLTERLRSTLAREYWQRGWDIDQDTSLAKTPVLQAISALPGPNPVTLTPRVYRDSRGWRLALGPQVIRLRKEEWRELFSLPPSTAGDSSLTIVDEQGRNLAHALYHEQEFRFRLTGFPQSARFFSLFYISADAEVTAVRLNRPLTSKETTIIPALGIFSIELPSGYERIVDDYVVVVSRNTLAPPASPWLFNGWETLFQEHPAFGLRLIVR